MVIRASIVTEGEQPETGGLLFGDRDDAVGKRAGSPWHRRRRPTVRRARRSSSAALWAPSASPIATRWESGGTVTYIGMWHSHPGGRPRPSPRDRRAMAEQAVEAPHRTYVIAGGDPAAPYFAAIGPYEVPEVCLWRIRASRPL